MVQGVRLYRISTIVDQQESGTERDGGVVKFPQSSDKVPADLQSVGREFKDLQSVKQTHN